MKEFRTRNKEENNNTEEELQVGKVVEEEEEGRQQWSNPIEFLLSCIAMSVRVVTIMKLLLFHVSRYNPHRWASATFGGSPTQLTRMVEAPFSSPTLL